MANVDLYCERIGAEFWAEPINALTNIAFFIAAWSIWYLSRRSSTLSPSIWLLIATAIAIGTGSFVFHTVATSWARLLDVIPILVFQLLFLWLYSRRIIAFSQPISGLLLAIFMGAALFSRQFPEILNGSLTYAPAFLTVLALGVYHATRTPIGRFDLLAAGGVFVASLFFRTVDNATCAAFPIGTHFMWHILNGAVVFLTAHTLVRRPVR